MSAPVPNKSERVVEGAAAMRALRIMLLALAVLCLGASVVAYAWGDESPWSVGGEEQALQLRALRQQGMECQPRPGRPAMFDCQVRLPGQPGADPIALPGWLHPGAERI
ncbi:MAG: hypothetical protein H7345_03490 [Rubritepida sp.]|nr:hypothetical protein [Rubritepida sp.]